ncbi:DUF1549 domain-containing protein [bacterium]|nr:DUF1549 domain-containing protein [bacterium]
MRLFRTVIGYPILAAMASIAFVSNAYGSDTGGNEIRVRVFEGLPAKWDAKTPDRPAEDSWTGNLFGFVRIPKKYAGRGEIVDRKAPFLQVAEFERAYPAGKYRVFVRSRARSFFRVDGQTLAETKTISPNASGHEDVPPVAMPRDHRWMALETNSQEITLDWTSDGKPHRFELASVIGDKNTRPETGQMLVAMLPAEGGDGLPRLMGPAQAPEVELTDTAWNAFRIAEEDRIAAIESAQRQLAYRTESAYWSTRHELARSMTKPTAGDPNEPVSRVIDRLILASSPNRKPPRPIDDHAFLRRVHLDIVGQVPTPAEQRAFFADGSSDRRSRWIDRLLNDPRRADAWMGYWLDVLAENPGILKPTLNNTGPFRTFVYESFRDNLPMDRFVTQLVRMEGSVLGGGAAGFSMASQNDSPMAAKAHIIAKAFLASEMKCARCHDAPKHPYEQSDLFELAALLAGKPVEVPKTSAVVVTPGARVPAISISLEPGDSLEPRWSLSDISPENLPDNVLPPNATTRDRLAALITWPGNRRFARVIVNRVWAVRTGRPFVDPVDDWDTKQEKRFEAALDELADDFVRSGYDLVHLDRAILNTDYYQGATTDQDAPDAPLGPARRRMSAEQLVDSLFAVSGKSFDCEELCLDPEGRRPAKEFISLGHPRRAWEMTAASNERDRPALGLPAATQITDLMQAFGWRDARQDPLTSRDATVTPLQPGILATGLIHTRIARLSDDNRLTEIALSAESIDDLADRATMAILSRPACDSERDEARKLFATSYPGRLVAGAKPLDKSPRSHRQRVSWSNHLSPRATEIQIEEEALVRAGDPPTPRLKAEFREIFEDWAWAMLNSPEFLFLP